MPYPAVNYPRLGCLIGAAVLCLFLGGSTRVLAADPLFVGSLAFLVEDETAQRLELTDEQRAKLTQLANRREDLALEFAISARRLAPAKRKERLAEFVAESERHAAKLLSEKQQLQLKAIQLGRRGMVSLGRPDIAQSLQLSEQQKQQVDNLLTQREQELTGGNEQQKSVVRAVYERRLAGVLTPEQRGGWERLTSLDPNVHAAGDIQAPKTQVSDANSQTPTGPGTNPTDELKFNFRYAPWAAVLDWFAEQADLSLVLDAPPPGTFNYTDSRTYTPAQAIDLLNSVLLTKGYTLVRRDRMLLVINLEDGVPPNLVTTVPVQELDRRGEFELVSCLFRVERITPEEAEAEIRPLIGPQGDIQVLPKARQILVTETAGRLRTIRDVLQSIEDPDGNQEIAAQELRHVLPAEAMIVIRQMLGLSEDENESADGSLRMAPDPLGRRLMLTGTPGMIKRVADILRLIDIPAPSNGGILTAPQFEVYSVNASDPESVLDVMQTLLADEPEVRLATDSKTGNLIAMGLPSHHATIRATLEQMERDGQAIEVLKLRYVDPQVAVLSVNKLFGASEGAGNAPRVDADVTTGQLLVRGTKAQVDQIRQLMQKMGETGDTQDDLAQRDRNVRLIPLTGSEADSVLKQIEQIWPTMRRNRIRQMTPADAIRSVVPLSNPARPLRAPPATEPTNEGPPDAIESTSVPVRSAESMLVTAVVGLSGVDAATGSAEPAQAEDDPATRANVAAAETAPPEIIVTRGANGLLIASKDLEALNAFEDLLMTLAGREGGSKQEFAVFYLLHATADAAQSTLNEVLGGDTTSSTGGGSAGGGLLGSLAGAALGDSGGGLVGSLLGLGGGGGSAASFTATGSFNVVAETRLNCLIVQANSEDMQLIEQLLQIIDQRTTPQPVQTIAAPRLIPVLTTSAEEIAEIVRSAFASRMASSPGQPRQPSPEEFIKALRGGGGRGGDSGRDREQEEAQSRMTIAVDKRRNALVVSAPDALFAEVQAFVSELDRVDPNRVETTSIVTLRRADRELVRRTLNAVLGEQALKPSSATTPAVAPKPATSNGDAAAGRGRSTQETGNRQGGNRPGGGNSDAARTEFLRALQRGAKSK